MILKDHVTKALQDKLAKLAKRPTHAEKPWMKFAGIAASDPEMVAELKRIEQIVDENFGQIKEQEETEERSKVGRAGDRRQKTVRQTTRGGDDGGGRLRDP
jgi:hypothetical protein